MATAPARIVAALASEATHCLLGGIRLRLLQPSVGTRLSHDQSTLLLTNYLLKKKKIFFFFFFFFFFFLFFFFFSTYLLRCPGLPGFP
jgi:hypothetical protein